MKIIVNQKGQIEDYSPELELEVNKGGKQNVSGRFLMLSSILMSEIAKSPANDQQSE